MKKTQRKNKRIVKRVIRSIVCLIIGIGYLIYLLFRTINNLVLKIFNKLPKLVRVLIVYSLIGLSLTNIINLNQVKTIVEEKTKVITIEKLVEVEKEEIALVTEEEQEEEENSILATLTNKNEINIFNKSIELGLTEEQALLVISISRHETGHWTSDYFNNYYNFGGVMCSTGIRKYSSYEEGLEHFVTILKKWYFDLGLTTVEQIGAKYCPVGAENDPNGLNKYWVGGVSSIYNSYLENVK